MTYEDLLSEYGTCTAAASALGLHKQTVNKWKGNAIPEDQQLEINRKNPRLRLDRAIVKKYRAALDREARAA